MGEPGIGKLNVGRIAERIVANELEYRGFRVSDLNKEGTSSNADLLAAKDGKTWQIQVKGASEGGSGWWINYGYCVQDIIDGKTPVFNRGLGFYEAQVVALVSVKSPTQYRCVVLPAKQAERIAQFNLDRDFRTPKRNRQAKKPGKMWSHLEYVPRTKDAEKRASFEKEQKMLAAYVGRWEVFEEPC